MSQIPLTIFDLVEPRSLHKLYGMLALALDEEVIVKQEASANPASDDTEAASHMSIILPTKKFRHTSIKYEMTVSIIAHEIVLHSALTSSLIALCSICLCYRSYSWNTLYQENEVSSAGSHQSQPSQVVPLFQDLSVYHLTMSFYLIVNQGICYQEAQSCVCRTVCCVSSCVAKSSNVVLSIMLY